MRGFYNILYFISKNQVFCAMCGAAYEEIPIPCQNQVDEVLSLFLLDGLFCKGGKLCGVRFVDFLKKQNRLFAQRGEMFIFEQKCCPSDTAA